MPHAVIVGGGIAGLTAALALHRLQWTVRVYEQAPELSAVGAGITLWPNAVRALRACGWELSGPDLVGGVRDPSGRWLSTWDGARLRRDVGDPVVAVSRAWLIEQLRRRIPQDVLKLGAPVREIPDADLVIGADGLRSTVREALFPGVVRIRPINVTAFRAIAAVEGAVEAGTTWGAGTEFGVMPLADGGVYWFAAVDTRERLATADLPRRLAGWHDPIPALLAATPTETVLRHDVEILHRPLRTVYSGRTVVIGDAAHAMTPFLGQGGCLGIEDAVTLAACVADAPVPEALYRYEKLRSKRVRTVVRQSAIMGALGPLLRPKPLAAVRDRLLATLPNSVSTASMARIVDWSAPAVPDRR